MSKRVARIKARAKSIHSDLRSLTQNPAQSSAADFQAPSTQHPTQVIAPSNTFSSPRANWNPTHPMASNDYPRPDFQRTELVWESLNGPWDLLFDDEDVGMQQGWQRQALPKQAGENSKRSIQVPYVFQCAASGINERGVHEVLWYERTIDDIRHSQNADIRLMLRFGAVDYHAKVWIDGQFVGEHRGGHVPFNLDITDAMAFGGGNGPRRLTMRIFDSAFDLTQPRGKLDSKFVTVEYF